jgi:hypothetical protein
MYAMNNKSDIHSFLLSKSIGIVFANYYKSNFYNRFASFL